MKIILLTTDPKCYSSEELKKAIEAEGHEAIVLDPNECYIHISDEPYVSHKGKKIETADICITRFSEDNTEYKLSIISHLESMGIYVLNTVYGIQLANDKLASQIFLFKNGFKTPKAAMLTDPSQLEFAVKSLDEKFPLIVKTINGAHGIGVMKVDSMSSLRSIVELLIAKEIKFVIQEFVENEGTQRIITIGGKTVAAMYRSLGGGDFRTNSEHGSKAEKWEPSDREKEVAEKVSELAKLNFCALDYIVGEDGEPIIFEFNSSPGFETMEEANPDLDIAKIVVDFCVEHSSEKPTQAEEPVEAESEVSVETGDKDQEEKSEQGDAPEDSEVVTIDNEKSDEKPQKPEVLEKEIIIKRINNDKPFKAKIDTGADYSSLHGHNIEVGDNYVKFEYNGVVYKVSLDRKVGVLNANGRTSRPMIKLDVVVDGKEYTGVDFTVTDRSDLSYDAIIGRNLLAVSDIVISNNEVKTNDEE